MPADTRLVPADAEDIISQIHQWRRREQLGPSRSFAVSFHTGQPLRWAGAAGGPDSGASAAASGIQGLHDALNSEFQASVSRIGELPPVIPTARGFLGRAAIRILQKLLWWHTRSLQFFGKAVGKRFDDELQVLTNLALEQAEMRAEIAALREEVSQLREPKPEAGGSAGR
jgi:hypothetical protein